MSSIFPNLLLVVGEAASCFLLFKGVVVGVDGSDFTSEKTEVIKNHKDNTHKRQTKKNTEEGGESQLKTFKQTNK